MKNAALLLASILFLAGCSTGMHHAGYRAAGLAPVDVWGTVSLIDPVAHRVDIDYVDGGAHRTRSYHYDEHSTKWSDVRDSDLRKGDEIAIHGHQNKDQWEAESVSRHHHDHD